MDESWDWRTLKTPDGCTIRSKQQFEYATPDNLYDVELFGNQNGTWYAIALPRDSERLIVYGSAETNTPQIALQTVVDKIRREGTFAGESPEESDD